ncbi:hypothetical protein niasHT_020062 [Heterodera trifolii]|uniref:Secreted protein n=1 Tax=Heterodera trifolii TaxID=157864 RepID=A0ABD2LM41_9BILA
MALRVLPIVILALFFIFDGTFAKTEDEIKQTQLLKILSSKTPKNSSVQTEDIEDAIAYMKLTNKEGYESRMTKGTGAKQGDEANHGRAEQQKKREQK